MSSNTTTQTIATTGIVAAVLAGILSIGSALADTNQAAISANQFSSAAVPVQTSVGATHDGVIGLRSAAQPQGWAQIIPDDMQRR